MPMLASACARAPTASRPGPAAAPAGRRIRQACPDRDVDGAYRELRAAVARGLAYRTGCSDLAEDLTQDVFVDLLVAARCRPPANTRAWLARVAQRHAADTIGSAVRERAVRARLEATIRAYSGATAQRSRTSASRSATAWPRSRRPSRRSSRCGCSRAFRSPAAG